MRRKGTEGKDLCCSFCGKSQKEVRKLIAGPSVYICDECVELCNDIITEEYEREEFYATRGLVPKPREIFDFLDQYVIGQERAKKVLSVAVHNHYKRIDSRSGHDDVELQKSNILLIGPSGSGKTLLAQTLAKFLNVPFTIADATSLTEAGYVGEDVENIVLSLFQAAEYNVDRTCKGIIYVDEIDKISRTTQNVSITRDVSGEGVQQALLKILEGTVASVPPQGGRKHPEQSNIQFDTSGVLFVCGGTFAGIEEIIGRRVGGSMIGFATDEASREAATQERERLLSLVDSKDLIEYGLIPEFVGRLPIHVTLQDLDQEALVRILKEPKNSIVRQYQAALKLDNVELVLEDGALEAIAGQALNRKTGARGLRSIVERLMTELMFELPSIEGQKRVTITREDVETGQKPNVELTQKSA